MASSKSAYDAFSAVDELVAKPVFGSDGAASWQEFRSKTKELQRESVAPALQVKKADRLGTGLATLEEERANEMKIRSDSGNVALGSGYTSFKRKHDASEAAERKRRKQIENKIRPDKVAYFMPSESFNGWKFDYVFTTREWGTGYYWDGSDSLKKLNGALDGQPESPSVILESIHGVEADNTSPNTTAKVKKKKKEKVKSSVVTVVTDVFNPREQVADAIRRRNESQKVPPYLSNSSNLPHGWETASDPSSGKVYYFNRSTSQQQWEAPVSDELPPGWKHATDSTSGKVYYYDANGQTSWVKPTP